MCTLAWGMGPDGWWLCFNRDEQRTRSTGEPPAYFRQGRSGGYYPRDPDGGGTWLAVSSKGFAVGLINHYPSEGFHPLSGRRSRGLLVPELLVAASAAEAMAALERTHLAAYPPFMLFALDRAGLRLRRWDGRVLQSSSTDACFLTSSSHAPVEVAEWRQQWWDQQADAWKRSPDGVGKLFRAPNPRQPALGVTMDRPDARTVSQSEISVRHRQLTWLYRAREADGEGYAAPVVLEQTLRGMDV